MARPRTTIRFLIKAGWGNLKDKDSAQDKLLLGVFPRSASADDPLRRSNAAINDRLHAYADNHQVFYLDLSQHFLDDLGRLR